MSGLVKQLLRGTRVAIFENKASFWMCFIFGVKIHCPRI